MQSMAPDASRQAQQAEQRAQNQRIVELRGWWLNRMAKGPRPFQERMVLFWHGHFATSFEKVRDAYLPCGGRTNCSAGWRRITGCAC